MNTDSKFFRKDLTPLKISLTEYSVTLKGAISHTSFGAYMVAMTSATILANITHCPAFETIPRVIRDSIYEYCLLFDGEINPYPYEYEHAEYKVKHQTPKDVVLGSTTLQKECQPRKIQLSVALLAVNKQIHHEACLG